MSATTTTYSFVLTHDLLRSQCENMISLALAADVHYYPSRGFVCTLIDQYQRMLREFHLHHLSFEYECGEPPTSYQRYKFEFEPILLALKKIPKSFWIQVWPKEQCVQGVNPETRKVTELFSYNTNEQITALLANELFPAQVTLDKFPYIVAVNRSAFNRILELAIIDAERVHLAICGPYLSLYTIGDNVDGVGEIIVPVHNINATNLDSYYATEAESHGIVMLEQKNSNSSSSSIGKSIDSGSREFVMSKHNTKCIVQLHSLRYISLACKSGNNSSEFIFVCMSQQYGLSIIHPIKEYGLSKFDKTGVLQQASWFRHHFLPISPTHALGGAAIGSSYVKSSCISPIFQQMQLQEESDSSKVYDLPEFSLQEITSRLEYKT